MWCAVCLRRPLVVRGCGARVSKSDKRQTFSTMGVIGPRDHESGGYLRFRRKNFRVKKWRPATFRKFPKFSKSPADFMVRCPSRYQYAVQTVSITVVVARLSRFRPRLCHRPSAKDTGSSRLIFFRFGFFAMGRNHGL